VYSRNFENHAARGGWADLNNTIHTLQYYDAESGNLSGGLATWGGLQDNGTTLQRAHAGQTLTPAGGDGGYVIVNAANAKDAVGEYVDLNPYLTTDGGHTFRTITPSCLNAVGPPITNCDPNPRFVAPLVTDVNNPNFWVTAGEDVWTDTAAWNTVCDTTSCDWTNLHDTGAGHSVTALAVEGNVIYAAWCGQCNPAGSASFASGIDTDYGGAWHTIGASNLPVGVRPGAGLLPGVRQRRLTGLVCFRQVTPMRIIGRASLGDVTLRRGVGRNGGARQWG
jgi:hypothetical protein